MNKYRQLVAVALTVTSREGARFGNAIAKTLQTLEDVEHLHSRFGFIGTGYQVTESKDVKHNGQSVWSTKVYLMFYNTLNPKVLEEVEHIRVNVLQNGAELLNAHPEFKIALLGFSTHVEDVSDDVVQERLSAADKDDVPVHGLTGLIESLHQKGYDVAVVEV